MVFLACLRDTSLWQFVAVCNVFVAHIQTKVAVWFVFATNTANSVNAQTLSFSPVSVYQQLLSQHCLFLVDVMLQWACC